MRTEMLTSAANPLLKSVRRAIRRGGLTDDGYCVAEGFHLLEEALRSNRPIKAVLAGEYVRDAVMSHLRGLREVRSITVSSAVLAGISSTETSQGVIALVQPPEWRLDHVLRGNALAIVLDGLQEPGNAGAIVRSAEAFGATGAVFLKGAVNPFNPKCVRASAGSIFRLPCVYGIEVSLLLAAVERRSIALLAAMPGGGPDIAGADFKRNVALVIGSEGRGIGDRLRQVAAPVRIPTSGVESLNAAVAAGILLYEARRQRMRIQ
jgi:TrmH family RNA methyltransferase